MPTFSLAAFLAASAEWLDATVYGVIADLAARPWLLGLFILVLMLACGIVSGSLWVVRPQDRAERGTIVPVATSKPPKTPPAMITTNDAYDAFVQRKLDERNASWERADAEFRASLAQRRAHATAARSAKSGGGEAA